MYTTDVLIDNFEFCESRNSGSETSASYNTQESVNNDLQDTSSNANDPFADFGAKIEVDDNELPF